MKIKAVALGAMLAIGSSAILAPTHASGIPVIDVANLQQTIAQYMNMIQQLRTLHSQLQQAKQQYEAITGSRGMGGLARTADNYIPSDWRGTLAQMQGGQIGQIAEQIKSSASHLSNPYYVSVDGQVKETLDGRMTDAANAQARNAHVFDQTKARQQRLNDLANRIDGAADAKAIADLQARIAAENGMLMNELVRLQAMNAMVENQRRVTAQRNAQVSGSMLQFDSKPKGKAQ